MKAPRALPAWRRAVAAALLATGLAASPPVSAATPAPRAQGPADVYFLVGGDRISGRTLAKRRRSFVVQTPYGRLTLPRERVVRVVWKDGREEVLRPEALPSPSPTPAATTLLLAIGGSSFWYAWDRRESRDATLRFRVWLDEEPLATYVDSTLDPQDLPGATVNTFTFDPERLALSAGAGTNLDAPQTRPGRVTLRLRLPEPPDVAGGEPAAGDGGSRARRLRVAYQVNEGTLAEPAWRDVAEAALDVRLVPRATTVVEIGQDAGRMEFSGFGRKRMKHTGSFRLEALAVAAAAAAENEPRPE